MEINNIKVNQDSRGGKTAFESDSGYAEMTFSKAGSGLLIIDHTEVSDGLRGQGIGRMLLDRLIELAKENNWKILPLCPYAKSEFDKDPSIRGMLKRSS